MQRSDLELACMAIALMLLPLLWDLLEALRWDDSAANALLVMTICAWLYRKERYAHIPSAAPATLYQSAIAILALSTALFLYVAGRMLGIYLFALAAMPLILASVILLLQGGTVLRHYRFILCFMLFALPLPGILAETLNASLKIGVSDYAERILLQLGYPIARSGVILHLGPYQLLVADACSGLQSILSLMTLATLYLHLRQRPSGFTGKAQIAVLALAMLPLILSANVLRVCLLAMITFHFGAERGTAFLHDIAGPLMLMSALVMLFGIDSAMQALCTLPSRTSPRRRIS
jgi:exosortase